MCVSVLYSASGEYDVCGVTIECASGYSHVHMNRHYLLVSWVGRDFLRT